MKVSVNGKLMEAAVREEAGASVGYADLYGVLAALGVPVLQRRARAPLVALRKLAELVKLPHAYDSEGNTFYIGQLPVMELPAEPVGQDVEPWNPVTPVIASGPGDRKPELYSRVIRQFRVSVNGRYAQRDGNTYCNIFVWDVTRAMGAEIPHWVTQKGQPWIPGKGWELDANEAVLWLRNHGPDHGWRRTDAAGAMVAANAGRPTVAGWFHAGGIGHVAMVRPGQPDPRWGPPIAQAGTRNFEDGHLTDGFGQWAGAVEFFTHE